MKSKHAEIEFGLSLTWSEKDLEKTRPDTRQNSRGQLGRSSSAKTARNSKMLRDQPTRQGVESCVRD